MFSFQISIILSILLIGKICCDCKCSLPKHFSVKMDLRRQDVTFETNKYNSEDQKNRTTIIEEQIILHVHMMEKIVIEERQDFLQAFTENYIIQMSKLDKRFVCIKQPWKTSSWKGCGYPDPKEFIQEIKVDAFCPIGAAESNLIDGKTFPSWYGQSYDERDVYYVFDKNCKLLNCRNLEFERRIVSNKPLMVWSRHVSYFPKGPFKSFGLDDRIVQEIKTRCPK